MHVQEPDKNEYARAYLRLVCGQLGWDHSVPAIAALLALPRDAAEEARDAAVLNAIQTARAELIGSAYGERTHRALPVTADYLSWYYRHRRETDLPFDFDGIDWTAAAPLLDERLLDERLFFPGMAWHYLNAFDHAFTYLITRGWGLSGAYTLTGRSWGVQNIHQRAKDLSIYLSILEVLGSPEAELRRALEIRQKGTHGDAACAEARRQINEILLARGVRLDA